MKKRPYIEVRKPFKKGQIYGPDSLIGLPTDCNTYFGDEDEFSVHFGKYEYGSVRCLKSFVFQYQIFEH